MAQQSACREFASAVRCIGIYSRCLLQVGELSQILVLVLQCLGDYRFGFVHWQESSEVRILSTEQGTVDLS